MDVRRLVGKSRFVLSLWLAVAAPAMALESLCADGVDNDNDTFTDGADLDCSCLDANVNFTGGCTANDVHFVVIGLGTLTDGCVSANDTMDIQLGAQLTTTANTRYDIGMWIGLDPNVESARTGSACERNILTPVSAVSPSACSLTGPYRDEDTSGVTGADVCGELETADNCGVVSGNTINAVFSFPDVTRLPCTRVSNGLVTLPTCTSWDNQSSDGSNNKPSCTNFTQAVPGTSSKCRCETATLTNVPRPSLALTCGCVARTAVGQEDIVDCGVEYTNPGTGTCSQASSGLETFEGIPGTSQATSCGTAAYMRFQTTYPDANGDVIASSTCLPTAALPVNGNPTLNCAGPGRGSVSDNTTGTLTWTPRNDTTLTNGVIGVNETDRLRFSFQRSSTISTSNLVFNTTAYWANTNAFSSPIQQTSLVCSVSVSATPVTLSSFEARRDGDDVVLVWSTSTETANAGFNVYAETSTGRRKLNRALVTSRAVDSVEPQRYRLRVGSEGLANARFVVEDVGLTGQTRQHGPFDFAGAGAGRRALAQPIDWEQVRQDAGLERGAGVGRVRSVFASAEPRVPSKKQSIDLRVSSDGLHRVTYQDLLAAGFEFAGVKTSDFGLQSGGQAVPLRAGGPSKFGPGSFLEFYGRALDSLYTKTNVYRLTAGRGGVAATVDSTQPNANVAPAASYLETLRIEHDRAYGFSSPTSDPWYDTLFAASAPSGTAFDYTVNADHVVAGAARLELGFWGMTDWPSRPDHHMRASWNGAVVADELFDGRENHPTAVELPAGAVQTGANALRIAAPADLGVEYDYFVLDTIALTYPRAFVARSDRLSFSASGARFLVTGFTSPDLVAYRSSGAGLTLLSGAQVVAQGGGFALSIPGTSASADYHVSTVAALGRASISVTPDTEELLAAGTADYLVISHPSFLGFLGPLVTDRESQGHRVRVVDVESVYAAFSGGVVAPSAIRDYVAHAYRNFGTRTVLLVGGDTYDYHDNLGRGAVSFVPSPYVPTSEFVNFAPADPWYSDVDADGVPDLAIGRLPVRSTAELASAIANTMAYESKSYGGTAVFAADAFDAPAVNFSVVSDAIAGGLPESWNLQRAYLDISGLNGARGILTENVNQGVALTNFVGHSGPTLWSFQGLLNPNDVAAWSNSGLPTVVTQYGCWNNYYVSPLFDSLSQQMLASGDRGAAAALGATALTEVESDEALGRLLGSRLTRPGTTLGQAVLEAKRELAIQHPEMVDVIMGWTILGDPGLVVQP